MTSDWTNPANDADGNPIRQTSLADVPMEMVTRGYNSVRQSRKQKARVVKNLPHVNIDNIRMGRGFGSYEE